MLSTAHLSVLTWPLAVSILKPSTGLFNLSVNYRCTIQYTNILQDPPDDPRDYIHRVGRTARGAAGKGKSLMFLQPSEIGFLKHCKEARIPLVEFEVPAKKIINIQSQLEKLISENYYLNKVCIVFYQKIDLDLR